MNRSNKSITEILKNYYYTLSGDDNVLHEPQVSYGKETFLDNFTAFDLISKGIPYSVFNSVLRASPFSKLEWADFMGLSVKTFQRAEAGDKLFKPIHSEKIIELSEVIEFGREVLGSFDKFKQWLNTTNFALGGKTPKELLSNSFGKELVMEELVNIDQGIFV